MAVGIVGYGAYIPRWRIKVQEIARARQQEHDHIARQLGVHEKSVPGKDEDTVTLSVAAAQQALTRACIDPQKISMLYIGSESHPYAVKPTATIVGQAIGINQFSAVADMEFACKAGTGALHIATGMVKASMAEYAMAIGADTAQAAPGDVLEFTAAAGGAAFIVGTNEKELLAEIETIVSFTTDTPDFWRRPLAKYPEHTGRFTAEPAYLYHVETTTKKILDDCSLKPSDIDYVVFHQPSGKLPMTVATRLGFTEKQIKFGLLSPEIGNTYSASSLLGLAAILDKAQPDQRILLVSYGSGSGCDGFILRTMPLLKDRQVMGVSIGDYLIKKEYISYEQYKKRVELMC